MKNEVAAVVILYNPNDSVYENIESYKDQVDILLIYDNSEVKNLALIGRLINCSKVVYIDNKSNRGIAEVLNMAAEKAINLGYKFLLTMDQDSKAPRDLIRKLIGKFKESDRVSIVSPLHSNKFNTHLKSNKNIEEKVMSVMTSGNLLSLNAYQVIGPFLEDFFIDYVDIEYCIRANFLNYQVIRINDIVLLHNEANLTNKKILSRVYYPSNNFPTRFYYKTRNLLYLRSIYKKKFSYPLKMEYDAYLRNVVKMLLFEKEKVKKTRMILFGILDYVRGIKGKKFLND